MQELSMPQIYAADIELYADSYTVVCWDATHTRTKVFKHYGSNLRQAEVDVDALRKFDIDAEIVTVGA
jgi:hypothetical protein